MHEQPKEITISIKSMIESNSITFSDIYTYDFSTWMSILYPIKDTNGKISSYFAIDIHSSMISHGQRSFIIYSEIYTAIIIVIFVVIQSLYINLIPPSYLTS